jgi:predicted RNA-binding Zn ribbon-like protein
MTDTVRHDMPRPEEPPVGGNLALDLCNAVEGAGREERRERLHEPSDLAHWATATGALPADAAAALDPAAPDAAARLSDLRCLRDALYAALTAELAARPARPQDLETIGRAVADARAALRPMPAPGGRGAGVVWDFPPGASGWQRLAWRVALAVPEALGPDRPAPLRQCGRCSWLFLDRSRGRGRQWCSSRRCGNRARVQRHYRKRSGAGPGRAP